MNTQPIPHRVELAAMLLPVATKRDEGDHIQLLKYVAENVSVALSYAAELIKQDAENHGNSEQQDWKASWLALNELHGQTVEELLQVRAELEALKADRAELLEALEQFVQAEDSWRAYGAPLPIHLPKVMQ